MPSFTKMGSWRPTGPAASVGCRRAALALGACLTLAVSLAPTHGFADETGLSLSGAYMRTIIPQRPAAGYFALKNETGQEKVLTAASSPACAALMLHQSYSKNGMEMMKHVESVTVPAHGSISFAPGGYHLMCMEPGKDMKPGNSVPVTLKFKDGGTLTSAFPVRGVTGN